jgi:acyl carrier protein
MPGLDASTALDESQKLKIKEIISEILEIEPEEMTETSLFKEDHEADSLLAIEILAALERTFKITISQDELPNMVNLEAVYDVVVKAPAA